MRRLIKKRSKKAGMSPGTLILIGEQKMERVKIRVIEYDQNHVREEELSHVPQGFALQRKHTVTWVNVDGLHDTKSLERLGDAAGLHPLVLEDILNTDQRPKVEDFHAYIYIVLKMLSYDAKTGQIGSEQVSLVVGSNFVFSFQEREGDVFNFVRERIRTNKGRTRNSGADYLAYSLLDAIVDNYFIVLEQLGEKIDSLEEELINRPRAETLHSIHVLKREMILLRKLIWPLRELTAALQHGESSLISQTTTTFVRDVHDHTIQIIDTIETYREMLSGLLDVYLSSASNRLNEVIKVLTIIATIFMPLTFIAGVYGMNFKHMPELEAPWAYPAIWLVMITVVVSMYLWFRKKGWL